MDRIGWRNKSCYVLVPLLVLAAGCCGPYLRMTRVELHTRPEEPHAVVVDRLYFDHSIDSVGFPVTQLRNGMTVAYAEEKAGLHARLVRDAGLTASTVNAGDLVSQDEHGPLYDRRTIRQLATQHNANYVYLFVAVGARLHGSMRRGDLVCPDVEWSEVRATYLVFDAQADLLFDSGDLQLYYDIIELPSENPTRLHRLEIAGHAVVGAPCGMVPASKVVYNKAFQSMDFSRIAELYE